jgi:hypothetical protein
MPEPNDCMRAAHTDEKGIDFGTFYYAPGKLYLALLARGE